MTTPVRITFTMRTPMIVPAVDKPLDALLSWAAVQQAEFADEVDPISTQHQIGIAKHDVGGEWCFMASNVSYEWVSSAAQVHYIKRSRLEDYAGAWDDGLLSRRPQFDGQRGMTKAGSYLQPTRWATTVTGFAVIEDLDRVRALLPWISHIGKLRHKDFGAVRSFEMVEDASAAARWQRRNLPLHSPFGVQHLNGSGCLISPYWARENQREIKVAAE